MAKSLEDVLDAWDQGASLDSEGARVIEKEFEKVMDGRLKEIEDLSSAEPDSAFTKLTSLFGLVNAAIKSRPPLLEKLRKVLKRVRKALARLAKSFKASGWSISYTFPVGLTFTISFSIVQTGSP